MSKPNRTPASTPQTHDAVIVVPGIMGSELVDITTGDVIWGLSNTSWYVSAWTTGQGLQRLEVRDADPSVERRRVRASRLLRFPAFMPVLAGVEPYTRLTERLTQVVRHPAALREFAYDWRLPVAYNAELLAKAVDAHLRTWRWRAESRGTNGDRARAVIVAHSMGGLLAQALTRIPGALDEVRTVVTLGTPFLGSLDAVRMLADGAGAPFPMPRRRLRAMARTLPSVYDLLPGYQCVMEAGRLRRLTATDLGVEPWRMPADGARTPPTSLPSHRCLVGLGQPTFQSMTVDSGRITTHRHLPELGSNDEPQLLDHSGDGTVYRYSAELKGAERSYVHQTHGALARCKEAMDHACAVVTERAEGAPLGGTQLGLDAPDLVVVGEPFTIAATGEQAATAGYYVVDLTTGSTEASPMLSPDPSRNDDRWTASVVLSRPGLYRVLAAGGGSSPVTRLLLATGK